MKTLKDISAEKDSIKAQILLDADEEVSYIKDAAERGCIGGNCRGLISYVDTHAFYAKHADEIDGILQEIHDMDGSNVLNNELVLADVRNYLAWLAYEYRAQEIMSELEDES